MKGCIMIYTLTLCLGMFLSICGQHKSYDYPNLQECERARDAFPKEVIGDGYALCVPKKGFK